MFFQQYNSPQLLQFVFSPSLTFLFYHFSDKVLGTLGEGTFGKVVKVKDVDRYVNAQFCWSLHNIHQME